jgi:hypothetical protein
LKKWSRKWGIGEGIQGWGGAGGSGVVGGDGNAWKKTEADMAIVQAGGKRREF